MEKKIKGVLVAFADREDDIIAPDINTVTALPNHMLYLTFKNGEHRLYDVKPLFDHHKLKAVFAPLKDKKGLFEKVKIIDGGWAVSWNGEIDIDGECLYLDSIRLDKYIASKTTNSNSKATKPKTSAREVLSNT